MLKDLSPRVTKHLAIRERGAPNDVTTRIHPPTLRGSLLFGNMTALQREPLRFLPQVTNQLGRLVRVRVLPGAFTQFDPERRFTAECSEGRPRFAYFPFGGGARQCIGNNFALMEAQLSLATLAQRFTLDLVPGHPLEPDPTFTLRPRYGMMMMIKER
jgi:hypothetical protein